MSREYGKRPRHVPAAGTPEYVLIIREGARDLYLARAATPEALSDAMDDWLRCEINAGRHRRRAHATAYIYGRGRGPRHVYHAVAGMPGWYSSAEYHGRVLDQLAAQALLRREPLAFDQAVTVARWAHAGAVPAHVLPVVLPHDAAYVLALARTASSPNPYPELLAALRALGGMAPGPTLIEQFRAAVAYHPPGRHHYEDSCAALAAVQPFLPRHGAG